MAIWFYDNFYITLSVLVSCLLASVVIPNILVVSFRKKLFDIPDERKIHKGGIPRLGGVAFAPIIIATTSFIISMILLGIVPGYDEAVHSYAIKLLLALTSIIILFLIGLKDDMIGVRYSTKFVIQIICGTLLFISGVRVTNLEGFLFLYELNDIMSYLTTIFLVVFIINAINLIDGIDGLASGVSILALLYYGCYFSINDYATYAMLSFVTMGTLIPFFYYNVFGNIDRHQKIFMGDTGSLTIGFILSFLSITILNTDAIESDNNVFFAFAPLTIPCFDVVRVALYRISIKKSPFKPDRNHIHHKFLDAGFSHRTSLLLILALSVICNAPMIWLSKHINVNILFVCIVIFWGSIFSLLNKKLKTKAAQ